METLDSWLAHSRRVLVFSGAGISTGCGIPDFRGPNGVWRRRDPVMLPDFLRSHDARVEYWDQKLELAPLIAAARPGPTHLAIVRLEARGRVQAVVTQNIDGLHHAAGSDPTRIFELHGSHREVECTSCGRRGDPAPPLAHFRRTREPPRCDCGGPLKFATISFGQALDAEVLRRAADEASRADLVLALGSTLSVQPAAQIPLLAARRGVPYLIVNQGETEHDAIATLRIDGDVDSILPAAIDAALDALG
jgi:NAD-dependent deacetylase